MSRKLTTKESVEVTLTGPPKKKSFRAVGLQSSGVPFSVDSAAARIEFNSKLREPMSAEDCRWPELATESRCGINK